MAYLPSANRVAHVDEPAAKTPIGRALGAGVVAGEVAGLVMALVMMAIFSFMLGKTPFLPFQAIGAMVDGGSALDGMDASAFITGFVIHQAAPSLVWGLVFGAVVFLGRPQKAYTLMLAGIAIGVLALVVDSYIVVPHLAEGLGIPDYWNQQVHPLANWLFHIAYGIALSFFPWKYDPSARRFA